MAESKDKSKSEQFFQALAQILPISEKVTEEKVQATMKSLNEGTLDLDGMAFDLLYHIDLKKKDGKKGESNKMASDPPLRSPPQASSSGSSGYRTRSSGGSLSSPGQSSDGGEIK